MDIKQLFKDLEVHGLHESDLHTDYGYGNTEDTLNASIETEDGALLEVSFLVIGKYSTFGNLRITEIKIKETNCWENDYEEYRLNELELAILEDVLKKKVQAYF